MDERTNAATGESRDGFIGQERGTSSGRIAEPCASERYSEECCHEEMVGQKGRVYFIETEDSRHMKVGFTRRMANAGGSLNG